MKPSELLARIDERSGHIEEQLEKILNQTTITNGRVTKLEAWRSRLNGIWFTILTIAGAGSAVAGLVIGILSLMK